MNTGRYTLKGLLNSSEIERIIVPELQRDYVWGIANVRGLLNSIIGNFTSREMISLDIKKTDSMQDVEDEIKKYLIQEYNKLHFNTRIGFIYAYHNNEYANKYFLIDGQQRITTMYLTMLASYKLAKNTGDFRKLYFNSSIPKIDYQVREVSHDFLVDFIEHELSGATEDFSHNCRFYAAYKFDKTAKTLLANYRYITDILKNNVQNFKDFISYLENYVEFNYFDTNISEQGERLYLYMNSRGEGLSGQELIKSTIVGRCSGAEKLNAGRDWEEWQDFFWKCRDRSVQSNADPGFAEFLKWSVVLHMNTFESPNLKELTDGQSPKERLSDYIVKGKEDQPYWISRYIQDNETFDIVWLRKIMEAVVALKSMLDDKESDSDFTKEFLHSVKSAIDYPKLLGTLLYRIKFPAAALDEMYSVWMYLKTFAFGYEARRNPDMATIDAVRCIKWISDNGVSYVWEAPGIEPLLKGNNAFNEKDIRFKLMNSSASDGDKTAWEEYFWSVTNDSVLCRFLRGKFNFIISLSGGDNPVSAAKEMTALFKAKVVDKKDKRRLRADLLKYGDISVYDGGGSTNLGGPWMARYNLLENDNDDSNWHSFMKKDESSQIVRSYLLEETEKQKNDPVLLALADGLSYTHNFKYLWYDKEDSSVKERCILLSQSQAKPNLAREIPIQLLHSYIKGSWCYRHNFCVYDFNIVDGEISVNNDQHRKHYYLDIFYDYSEKGGFWNCRIGYRHKNLSQEILDGLKTSKLGLEWVVEEQNPDDPKSFRKIRALLPIKEYTDMDNIQTFAETVTEAKQWFTDIMSTLKTILA